MLERKSRLDSPVLSGRLRKTARHSDYERRAVNFTRSVVISDIRRPAQERQIKSPQAGNAISSVDPEIATSRPPRATMPTTKVIPADIRVQQRPPRPSAVVLHTRTTSSQVLKRQIVASQAGNKAMHGKRRVRVQISARGLLTFVAIVVIIGGLGIGLHGFRVNKEVAMKTATLGTAAVTTDEGTGDSDVPSEAPVADPASHKVAADRPRILSIDKIDVRARVLRLGVKANNQLAAPSNIFDAGWYDESSKPGEGGAVVIDGHVSGPTKHGVFYNLKKLVAGDQIKIERGDGKVFIYKVVKSVTYAADKVDMAAALTPVTKGKPGLNLITCSGEIDASRNHYKDRTVVFAEQIN